MFDLKLSTLMKSKYEMSSFLIMISLVTVLVLGFLF